MPPPAVAQFHGVSKQYGRWPRRPVRALIDIELTIPAGQIFGLVGPNRAGKSTLVKLLLSLCQPTAGQITRLGRSWRDRGTLARVGYIHESQALPRYLTARGLLEYYGAVSGVPPKTLRQRCGQLLERVGLADRGHEPIVRFSKGMLQRLALAQALVNDPDLLVFDEPTEGMDLHARRLVDDAMMAHRAGGRSVLLVSHCLADVERLCDQVAVLRKGRLVFAGRLAELIRPASDELSLETALEPLYREELVTA
jgi:ABC-2 type transport system ATP-binding protein